MPIGIFLDRDGVINELIFNKNTGEYESPHFPEDFILFPWTIPALIDLQNCGMLFLISNQPSYAKGKTSLENINKIHDILDSELKSNNIIFTKYYYCYHHPNGIEGNEYTGICGCRKPKTEFLEDAEERYGVDMKNSWFIGDQDSDIECGKKLGMKTIIINNPHSEHKRGKIKSDFSVDNLKKAVEIILNK